MIDAGIEAKLVGYEAALFGTPRDTDRLAAVDLPDLPDYRSDGP
jgi:hypothetical protein